MYKLYYRYLSYNDKLSMFTDSGDKKTVFIVMFINYTTESFINYSVQFC